MRPAKRSPEAPRTLLPARDATTLTADHLAVQAAYWPGFTFSRRGQDRDLLRGAVAQWLERGSPRHDDGTVCSCPLGAAWPCRCPASCSRCERHRGMEPLGEHRYDHRADTIEVRGRWRTVCSCGWQGELVALPGQGHQPWLDHWHEANDAAD